jgi:uncharacterized protein (DUF927 family)
MKMNVKAEWVKDLEKREAEIILLRKEQILRESELYQREQTLMLNQNLLRESSDFIAVQKDIQKRHLAAVINETRELGVMQGRSEEREKNRVSLEAAMKEVNEQKNKEIELLKDLLTKAIAALQVKSEPTKNERG